MFAMPSLVGDESRMNLTFAISFYDFWLIYLIDLRLRKPHKKKSNETKFYDYSGQFT